MPKKEDGQTLLLTRIQIRKNTGKARKNSKAIIKWRDWRKELVIIILIRLKAGSSSLPSLHIDNNAGP